ASTTAHMPLARPTPSANKPAISRGTAGRRAKTRSAKRTSDPAPRGTPRELSPTRSGSARRRGRVRRLRDHAAVDLARLVELREDVIALALRPPVGPRRRHLLELVDPPEGVFGRGAIPHRLAAHLDPDRVGEGLGVSGVEREAIGRVALGPQVIPAAARRPQRFLEIRALPVGAERNGLDLVAVEDERHLFERRDRTHPRL